MDGKRIILAAHRGDRKRCPENTMAAFESALRFGVDMIETDVHMTLDGELIIIHDRETERTTGSFGLTDKMTLEQIKRLDAGSWFSDEFIGERIPTLDEFATLVEGSGVLINWELKDYPRDVGERFAFEAADKLIAAIKRHNLESRSMINSFSDKVLEYVRGKYGNAFPIHGQGISDCRKSNDKAEMDEEELYDWCCLYPNEKGCKPLDFPENFEYCKRYGIIPCVCVPDELEAYERYIELGCRMFTSNDIYEADKILRRLNHRG